MLEKIMTMMDRFLTIRKGLPIEKDLETNKEKAQRDISNVLLLTFFLFFPTYVFLVYINRDEQFQGSVKIFFDMALFL